MSLRTVVVLGATPKADRFAYRAMQMLQQHGFRAVPVNPAFDEVLGEPCRRSITEVPQPIDTLTLYVRAARSEPIIDEILQARPGRIIFNPGAENDHLAEEAQKRGIEIVHACTLVMLETGSF